MRAVLDWQFFRVAEGSSGSTTSYHLTADERIAVMRENERRGVMHLVTEREAESALTVRACKARDGAS